MTTQPASYTYHKLDSVETKAWLRCPDQHKSQLHDELKHMHPELPPTAVFYYLTGEKHSRSDCIPEYHNHRLRTTSFGQQRIYLDDELAHIDPPLFAHMTIQHKDTHTK